MAKLLPWPEAAAIFISVALMAAIPATSLDRGYLPMVGPVPMRFLSPVNRTSLLLPPLIHKSSAESTNGAAVDPAHRLDSTDVTALLPVPQGAENDPKLFDPDALLWPDPPTTPAEPGDTRYSESVLQYLLPPSTNAPGARLALPIFVPPKSPVSTPSSHAIYEIR